MTDHHSDGVPQEGPADVSPDPSDGSVSGSRQGSEPDAAPVTETIHDGVVLGYD